VPLRECYRLLRRHVSHPDKLVRQMETIYPDILKPVEWFAAPRADGGERWLGPPHTGRRPPHPSPGGQQGGGLTKAGSPEARLPLRPRIGRARWRPSGARAAWSLAGAQGNRPCRRARRPRRGRVRRTESATRGATETQAVAGRRGGRRFGPSSDGRGCDTAERAGRRRLSGRPGSGRGGRRGLGWPAPTARLRPRRGRLPGGPTGPWGQRDAAGVGHGRSGSIPAACATSRQERRRSSKA